MDDAALLRGLLGAEGLTAPERGAFALMQDKLTRWSALTDRQRRWAQEVGARLALPGVQAPGEALGKAKPRATWDPSKKTRRMGTSKLEAMAAELSAEIQQIEKAQAKRRARA